MKVNLWKLSTLAIAATFIGLSNFQPALADSHHSAHAAQCSLTESVINGHKYSVAKVIVHATPHQVWNILTDYDNAPKIFPQVKKCHVVKDEGATKLLKHTVAPSGPVGTYTYLLKITERAPHGMEWQRVSGAFKEVKGFWKLEPLDSRTTLCTYASYVDGGFFIPQPLIRRQSRIDMPAVMATLKNQVENKTQIAEKPN
ncbi:MAG: SRPBCC family protein [Candidatus Obscuribacterales bacterium]|nr:SRPBCC family protein [Candidatus Obscuribacterales bacterium]